MKHIKNTICIRRARKKRRKKRARWKERLCHKGVGEISKDAFPRDGAIITEQDMRRNLKTATEKVYFYNCGSKTSITGSRRILCSNTAGSSARKGARYKIRGALPTPRGNAELAKKRTKKHAKCSVFHDTSAKYIYIYIFVFSRSARWPQILIDN